MTSPIEEPVNEPQRRGWTKTALVIVGMGVIALVVWGIMASMNGTSTAAINRPVDRVDSGPVSTVSPLPETPAASATQIATDVASDPAPQETPAPEPAAEPAPEQPVEPEPAPEPAPAPAAPEASAAEPHLSDDAAQAAIPQPVAPPVELKEPATVKSGLDAKVTDISAVEGEAVGIGEIAGPAIKFTIEVTNDTDAEVSTNGVAVNLEYGKNATPAGQLSGPGTADFPTVIAIGKTASATYVFNVPVADRGLVRILLSVDASLPIAAFEGAL